ncbi:MAG TPA: PqqD family protein [Ramlibacter sp.]|nr:PqqD family protein [Ramlibacter sp.]
MRTVFVATAGLETAPLANGSVVYNLKTSKFIMLNPSANLIWSALSRAHSEQDLVDLLRDRYDGVDASAARQAVQATLRELQQLELVAQREGEAEPIEAGAPAGVRASGPDDGYAPPSVKVLDEEDLLKVFQITAAEISVASCWWIACTVGCP